MANNSLILKPIFWYNAIVSYHEGVVEGWRYVIWEESIIFCFFVLSCWYWKKKTGETGEWFAVFIKSAKECAQFYQRSSSCVEGRNAQLSLRQHGIHRLSDTHLQAQTVIHNFHIKRDDGITPAMRFFEAEHGNIFDQLLTNMDYPARPRKHLPMAA